jgi:polar amino acid transport system substrate-binding protein
MNGSRLAIFAVAALLARSAAATETITIAAEDDWPPYSALNKAKGTPEGFAVDVVRESFKSQGVDVNFEALPFARCLHYAETGKVMGCFDATIVDSNRDTYCWHPTPMFEESLVIFGSRNERRTDLKIKDLEGHIVGSTTGYTYPDEFTRNRKIKHFTVGSDDQLVKMLGAGRVEYILINGMPGYHRVNADPRLRDRIKQVGVISNDGFWVAFTKKNPDGPRYCALFEKGLQEIHKNGKYKAMETAFRRSVGL